MNIEVFVHGVPNGQSFWEKAEDQKYIGNFYDQNSSDTVIIWSTTTLSATMGGKVLILVFLSDLTNIVRTFGVYIKFSTRYSETAFSIVFWIIKVVITNTWFHLFPASRKR